MINPFQELTDKLDAIQSILKELTENKKASVTKTDIKQPLNVKQAASFLNLKVPTIYSKVSNNELPFIKKGNRLYFLEIDLLQYLKEGKVKTISEIEAAANSYIQQSNSKSK